MVNISKGFLNSGGGVYMFLIFFLIFGFIVFFIGISWGVFVIMFFIGVGMVNESDIILIVLVIFLGVVYGDYISFIFDMIILLVVGVGCLV